MNAEQEDLLHLVGGPRRGRRGGRGSGGSFPFLGGGASSGGILSPSSDNLGMLTAAINLYNQLNTRERTARDSEARPALEFDPREFTSEGSDALNLAMVRTLTRAETAATCEMYADIQERVDRLDRIVRENNPSLSPQQHGTAVHLGVASEINGLDRQDYRAEVSAIKSVGEKVYGTPDSVRIDGLELTRNNVVCVYDLKTGRAGLSLARTVEIAAAAYKVFDTNPTRFIVIEVRPNR